MANNGSNYGLVSRCPRLESNVADLEEDCAPETSPFRDNSSCDIYSQGSAHPFPRPESYHHHHGPKSPYSQQIHQQQEFDSVMSSSEYSSEYFLTDNSVDSLHKNPEVDNLGTDLDTLRISEKRNSTQQPEVTKTEVAIDDEAIGSIASTDSILSTEIEKSRQLYQQDEDGDTLLHLAIIHGEEHYALRIIELAFSEHQLNIQNSQQQTALHLAVVTHQPGLARHLVSCGASLITRDRCGNTPLHLACRDGDLECVRYLTAPLGLKDFRHPNYTPHCQLVPQDLTIKNYEGETCLHLAACRGHLPVLHHLFNDQHCTADVNVQEGKSGRTVLHKAAETNNFQLVGFLLQQRQVNLEALTYDSRTPLCLAMDRKLTDMATVLKKAGADESYIHGNSSFTDPDDDLMDGGYDDFSIAGQPVQS